MQTAQFEFQQSVTELANKLPTPLGFVLKKILQGYEKVISYF
jgi:hypothetical protein